MGGEEEGVLKALRRSEVQWNLADGVNNVTVGWLHRLNKMCPGPVALLRLATRPPALALYSFFLKHYFFVNFVASFETFSQRGGGGYEAVKFRQ